MNPSASAPAVSAPTAATSSSPASPPPLASAELVLQAHNQLASTVGGDSRQLPASVLQGSSAVTSGASVLQDWHAGLLGQVTHRTASPEYTLAPPRPWTHAPADWLPDGSSFQSAAAFPLGDLVDRLNWRALTDTGSLLDDIVAHAPSVVRRHPLPLPPPPTPPCPGSPAS